MSTAGAGQPPEVPSDARSDGNPLRARLGPFGVWVRDDDASVEFARHVEQAGFSALWIGRAAGDLHLVEEFLAATDRLTVATGILNIWTNDPTELAAAADRVEARFPGRLVLGIGAGHSETVGARYARPYQALVSYLDELDRAGLSRERRVLAALGPRMLALSAERAAGAHPYLVPPEFSRQARTVLGPDALLAPDQMVILETDPERAHALARAKFEKYLGMANYRAHLGRMGFLDGEADEVTERTLDALLPWGTPQAVAGKVAEHLVAGADHVAVQVLHAPDDDVLAAYATLGAVLSAPSGTDAPA